MTGIHQKYLDMGEKVYLGITDSIEAFPGWEKVKLRWYVNADPKIETTVIYWNLRRDSVVKPFVREQDGIQKDSVIIPLPEGTYQFELINVNSRNEKSLISSIQGISYGDTYIRSLNVRPITSLSIISFDASELATTVRITWGTISSGCIDTRVSYKKHSTDETLELSVNSDETMTTLTDVGNRLKHPDDFISVSSLYTPTGSIDTFSTSVQREQIVVYVASGTRADYNVDGIFTGNVVYVDQDKTLRMIGENIFECNRVADAAVTSNTQFRLTLKEDHTFDIAGYFNGMLNTITNSDGISSYDPVTGNLTLRYKRTTSSTGSYAIIEENFISKTTPFEAEAPKPFGDMRASIPGDNISQYSADYAFSKLHDGIVGDNGYLSASASTGNSFTLDLKQVFKLSRMVLWPAIRPYTTNPSDIYGNANVRSLEIWGIKTIDLSKPANYWQDNINPTGTFKEDWEYLGLHNVTVTTPASVPEMVEIGNAGFRFNFPETAAPVRYIRCFVRNASGNAPPANNLYRIGELSFFGDNTISQN
jgi:hypothetical protein